jgi:DNA-directed RNA polymerase subunit RPC12/RpoP
MICPHCNANLLYKERGGKRCSRCRKKFALEPKQNPLRLHDLRFQKLDMRLSRGGGLFYTGPQLLHQAGRKLLDGKKPNYGCGVALLVGVGFFTFFLIQSEMADTILLIAGATTELRPVPASATPETPEQLAQAVGFMTWPD